MEMREYSVALRAVEVAARQWGSTHFADFVKAYRVGLYHQGHGGIEDEFAEIAETLRTEAEALAGEVEQADRYFSEKQWAAE